MSYQFHGQRATETVRLVSRQHPFVLLHPLLISGVFVLIPLVGYIFLAFGTILMVVMLVAWGLAIIHAAMAFYAWWNTILMLTNERVVFLHQKSLIQREMVECSLPNIQQISHRVKGLLHTLFGYGTVTILTGGSQASIDIVNVPDPYEIQQKIQLAASGEKSAEEDVL